MYATSDYCQESGVAARRELSANVLSVEKLLGDDKTKEEGRNLAKESGMLVGRKREMMRHLKSECASVPGNVKHWMSVFRHNLPIPPVVCNYFNNLRL